MRALRGKAGGRPVRVDRRSPVEHVVTGQSTSRPTRKIILTLVKFAVSAGLLWLVFRGIEFASLQDSFSGLSPWTLAIVAGQTLLHIVLTGVRWRAVLRSLGSLLPLRTAIRLSFIGNFFNQTLPSSIGGDAVRMYLGHRGGLPVARAVTSVLLERVVTVLGLIALVLVFQPVLLATDAGEETGAVLPWVALLAAGAIAGTLLLTMMDRLPVGLHRFRLVRGLAELSADTRRLMSPRRLAGPMAWTLVTLLNLTLSLCVLAWGMGIDLGFIEALALFPLVILAVSIPISIGGWGVREGAMVAVLALIEVPSESAFALSVVFGLISIAASLPGGLVWLMSGSSRREMAKGSPDGGAAGSREATGQTWPRVKRSPAALDRTPAQ